MNSSTEIDNKKSMLKEKRERLSELRSNKRDLIDELKRTSKLRNEKRSLRDKLNFQAKEAFITARESRNKRDQINEEVQVRKQMRDILREDAERIKKRLTELSSQMKGYGRGNKNHRVSERIKHLERRLETTPFLTKEKERETLQQLEELSEEFERLEEFRELRGEFREIKSKLRNMQTEIKAYHTSVTTLAQESQVHQEKMLDSTKSAKKIKDEADKTHAEVIEYSKRIKEIRNQLDQISAEIRKISSEVQDKSQAMRIARKTHAKRARERRLDVKAEEILSKYKDGDNLTLDEFKVLMERGLI